MISECPGGEYLSNDDPGTCTPCPIGTYKSGNNSNTQCMNCTGNTSGGRGVGVGGEVGRGESI